MLSASAGTPLAEIEALVGERASSWPSSRWTTARSSAAPPGPARSAACSPPISRARAASRRARRATISSASRRVRPRRDLQDRRPRGEERHRLRSLQAAGRLLRHARGADRGDHQGPAAPETEAIVLCSASTMRAPAAMTAALAPSCEVSGAAHLPRRGERFAASVRSGRDALRVEGFAPSVRHRRTR